MSDQTTTITVDKNPQFTIHAPLPPQTTTTTTTITEKKKLCMPIKLSPLLSIYPDIWGIW